MGLVSTLDDLNACRSELGLESPPNPPSAYERAKKGIEAGEASYEVDEQATTLPPSRAPFARSSQDGTAAHLFIE